LYIYTQTPTFLTEKWVFFYLLQKRILTVSLHKSAVSLHKLGIWMHKQIRDSNNANTIN